MEVDTGAAVSVVSEDTYKKLFFNLPLKRASVCLKTFTGEQIPILGEIAVEVYVLPPAASSTFSNCSQRQGTQSVWKRLADAFST